MNSQLNELMKGEKTSNNPNRYILISKKKEGKLVFSNQPTREKKPAKDVVGSSEEKEVQKPPPVAKGLVPKVREIMKPSPFFNFEDEIQNLRIPVPLSELVKLEYLKKSLSKLLQSEPTSHPTESINL
jgi:hypothetical protein